MIRCEENTKRHQPFAYGAVDESGNPCAVLVAIRVSTLSDLPWQISSRSIMYAQPIYADTPAGHHGIRMLLSKHDEFMCKKTLFAEVRPLHHLPADLNPLVSCGYQRLGYLNYELRIDAPESSLFNQMSPKCRNNLRSAQRKGVTATEVDPSATVDTVYSLLAESYSHSKIPMVDCSLLHAAAKYFCHSKFRVVVAKFGDQPVAAGCFLLFNKRVLCWYAGTKRIPGVPAMSTVFWEAIRQFSREGFEIFDFAGGGWEGENYGPGRFKAKFGGNQTNFGRYRKVYAPWKMRAAESIYQKVREYIAPRNSGTVH